MKFMLTKQQTEIYRRIFRELKVLAEAACKEGDVPYMAVAFGSVTPLEDGEFLDNELYFGIYNTTPDILLNLGETLADQNDELLDAIDQADEAMGDKDPSDINSWINIIDSSRLN